MGRIGFVVAGFLAMVCAVFLGIAMADGSSVVTIKSDSPLVTQSTGPRATSEYTARYGVGVFQDSNRWQWTEKDHLLEVAGCNIHQRLGNVVKGCSLIAICFSAFAVLTSLLGAMTGKGIFGLLTTAFSAIMFVTFCVAMSCGWAVYDIHYACTGGEVLIADHFDLNYGLFFLLIGTIVSLVMIAVLVVTGALADDVTTTTHEPADEKLEVIEEPKEA